MSGCEYGDTAHGCEPKYCVDTNIPICCRTCNYSLPRPTPATPSPPLDITQSTNTELSDPDFTALSSAAAGGGSSTTQYTTEGLFTTVDTTSTENENTADPASDGQSAEPCSDFDFDCSGSESKHTVKMFNVLAVACVAIFLRNMF